MPAWFWVDGYNGATLYGSRSIGLIMIEVEITSTRYVSAVSAPNAKPAVFSRTLSPLALVMSAAAPQ